MKKIVFASEFISPESNSTGYFWHSLIKRTAEESSDVVIISSQQVADIKNVNFAKVYCTEFKSSSIFMRVLSQLLLSAKIIIKIIKEINKGDVLVSGTNPALMLIFIPILKLFINFRWILLAHDVMPENLVPAGIVKSDSFFLAVLKKYFSFVYAAADHIVAIGHDMKELIENKANVSSIDVIQNWVNHDDIDVCEKNSTRIFKDLKISSDDFVFGFFGNIGRVQGVSNILQAANLLCNDHIKVLFIGAGAYKSSLIEHIKISTKGNVIYYGPLDQSKKSDGLAACDVALVTLADGMYGLGVPSKAYFSMAANKALLAVMDPGAEVSQMVSQHNIGWTCRPNDPQSLADLMNSIYLNRFDFGLSSPREILIKYYSEDVALSKFSKIIKKYLF